MDLRQDLAFALMPGGRPMANIWNGKDHFKDETLDGFTYLAPVSGVMMIGGFNPTLSRHTQHEFLAVH